MQFAKTLSRNEMKNIMAGNGGFGGCAFQCCFTGGGGCAPGVQVQEEGEDCTSHTQCQSDYIDNQGGDPCTSMYGETSYTAALCYN